MALPPTGRRDLTCRSGANRVRWLAPSCTLQLRLRLNKNKPWHPCSCTPPSLRRDPTDGYLRMTPPSAPVRPYQIWTTDQPFVRNNLHKNPSTKPILGPSVNVFPSRKHRMYILLFVCHGGNEPTTVLQHLIPLLRKKISFCCSFSLLASKKHAKQQVVGLSVWWNTPQKWHHLQQDLMLPFKSNAGM